MVNQLMSADQVKRYLNISDFRHLTKDKLIQFVSAIPSMDKEVAIKAIEQFPEFSGCAKVLVMHHEALRSSILEKNGADAEEVMDGYKQTLAVLSKLATAEKTTPEDRRFFAEKMVDISDKMAAFDADNKTFLLDIDKNTVLFGFFTFLFLVSILGIKVKGTRIPRFV